MSGSSFNSFLSRRLGRLTSFRALFSSIAAAVAVPFLLISLWLYRLETQAGSTLYFYVLAALASFLVAISLMAYIAHRWTQAITTLANDAQRSLESGFEQDPAIARSYETREIRLIRSVLKQATAELGRARQEKRELLRTMDSRVAQATRDLMQTNSQLEAIARKDHLTALSNRRHFEHKLRQTLRGRRASDGPFCVLLADIDNFKVINDEFGHAAGDAVLMQVAMLLEKAMRPGDLVARYGGDEFVSLMHCDPQIGMERAQEIRRMIDQWEFHWEETQMHVTVSVGLLEQLSNTITDAQTMLHEADKAMYRAKQAGRNTIVEIRA